MPSEQYHSNHVMSKIKHWYQGTSSLPCWYVSGIASRFEEIFSDVLSLNISKLSDI